MVGAIWTYKGERGVPLGVEDAAGADEGVEVEERVDSIEVGRGDDEPDAGEAVVDEASAGVGGIAVIVPVVSAIPEGVISPVTGKPWLNLSNTQSLLLTLAATSLNFPPRLNPST